MPRWTPDQDCSAADVGRALGLELTDLGLIQRNPYCAIYRGRLADGQLCIVKTYFGDEHELPGIEARAANLYRETVQGMPNVAAGGALAFAAEESILALHFVDGACFTDEVYAAARKRSERPRIVEAARTLGEILRRLYEASHEHGAVDPFMEEYATYAGGRLEQLPWPVRLPFRGCVGDAGELLQAWRDSGCGVSFCHGDFTFRNLHLNGRAIGLIDFANARWNSHILNDIYNINLASRNMFLPPAFRNDILASLVAGMGNIHFPEALHRFFYEYHRRRWLMLKLTARRPWPWLQACRAMLTFARPYRSDRLGPLRALVSPANT